MVKRNVRANQVRKNIREEESRQETAWKPPSLLDAPEPRQGMAQRWIATSIQGKDTQLSIMDSGQVVLALKECCYAKCLWKNTRQ